MKTARETQRNRVPREGLHLVGRHFVRRQSPHHPLDDVRFVGDALLILLNLRHRTSSLFGVPAGLRDGSSIIDRKLVRKVGLVEPLRSPLRHPTRLFHLTLLLLRQSRAALDGCSLDLGRSGLGFGLPLECLTELAVLVRERLKPAGCTIPKTLRLLGRRPR